MTKTVELHTNHGLIRVELDDTKAPKTVANFLAYVKAGHYDGTVFHRVIKGFMVQGGGFEPGMTQKPTQAMIDNEAGNGLKNDKYTLAMARTNAPHSASSQFFINAANNDFLNFKSESPQGWGYAVFGKVVAGNDVVDAIERVATGRRNGHDDVPLEDAMIQRAVEIA
ncbi:peptidylprolyl isomerase [Methylibium sp.]|uniref:peptidylprolyl isomerase n=1 Tax=Methylibium sp. TaxID=2067992 RepID=UPI00286BA2C1|nr:peptidylprolyl isomerase [Methylibium sp.]